MSAPSTWSASASWRVARTAISTACSSWSNTRSEAEEGNFMASIAANVPNQDTGLSRNHVRVIAASSIGTVFEWYDFYLYGSLATIIGKQFFTGLNPTSQFIFALLAFAAGF